MKKSSCRQLSLFPIVLEEADLLALNSPRQTFYRIWIEENAGLYSIVKESGAGGKVLDRRSWKAETAEEAKGFLDRKLKEKTNPARKSPRRYTRLTSPES